MTTTWVLLAAPWPSRRASRDPAAYERFKALTDDLLAAFHGVAAVERDTETET